MTMDKRKREREVPHGKNAIQEGRHQQDQNSETQFRGFRLLDFPSSIILEILTRMPIQEALHCRCTCKTLCKLISDPYFAKHFLSKSNFSRLLYRSTIENQICFVKLGGFAELGFKTMEHVSMRHFSHTYDLELVGSSMGLLCLWNKSPLTNTLYITNPLLGEYAVLPKPMVDFAAIDETFWFGYIPTMGIFKAIRVRVRKALLQSNPRKYYKKSEVHVLAIGTESDTWKYVTDAPFPRRGKFCKTILNGCLHWMVGDDKESLQLHSFNMEVDRAHSFQPPPNLGSECSLMELGVVGNYLGLIGSSSDYAYFEIWSMKDYGVASSWTKHIITRFLVNPSLVPPITFWKDGELKYLRFSELVLSYDPKEKKYIGSFDLESERKGDSLIYTPSLLSLTHLSSGARLRVKNAKSYFT